MLTTAISFTPTTARERALLRSDDIGGFALAYARSLFRDGSLPNAETVLADRAYPFLTEANAPGLRLLSASGPAAEQAVLCAPPARPGTWHVILRPLRGRVSLRRLHLFCKELAGLDPTAHRTVLSVIPFSPLTHPLWQCRAVPRAWTSGTAIRIDHTIGDRERVDADIYGPIPELDRDRPEGSQHLTDLFHDDGALCAVSGGSAEAANEEAVLFTSGRDYLDELPPFFRLPIFDMDADSPMNIESAAGLAREARLKP